MEKIRKIESLYENYDALIIRCVPDYQKILQVITENINDADGEILDIGIGTGNLEKFIFQKFTEAKIIGVDTSLYFLNEAKAKFSNRKFKTVWADIRNYQMKKNKFDKILASLAIHHFEDNEKIKLFQDIYQALTENGIFINFDMIKPKTETELLKSKEKLFKKWKTEGLSNSFIEKEKKEMVKRDRLVELSKQKEWLEKIGFTFKVIYKKRLFCVYMCKKQ